MTSIDTIINRQLLKWEYQRAQQLRQSTESEQFRPAPIVTISRQAGSRGSYLAKRLAETLGYELLHRQVIDAICESSGYRKRIVASLDDNLRTDVELMIESLFFDHSVDNRDYFRHLVSIVSSLSSLGGVLLLGRAGNFILGPNQGFHIRVVSPMQLRIRNLMKYENMSKPAALVEIESSDSQRRQFVRKLFGGDVDSPENYDLVINLAAIDVEEILGPIVELIEAKFQKLTALKSRED